MKFIKRIDGDSFFTKGNKVIRVGRERWTRSVWGWFAQEVIMNDDFTDIARDVDGKSWGAKGKVIAQANTKKDVIAKVEGK